MRFDRILAAAFAIEFVMYAVIAIALAVNGLYTGAPAIVMAVLGIVVLAGAIHFYRVDRRRARSRSAAHG